MGTLSLPTVPLPAPAGLDPDQTRVAELLTQGLTVTRASIQTGILRTRINEWLNTDPAFQEAYRIARGEFADTLADELKELSALALSTIRDLITNPKTPPSVRLRTSLAVLNRPDFPKQTWCLPEPLQTQEARHAASLAFIKADWEAQRLERWAREAEPDPRPRPRRAA